MRRVTVEDTIFDSGLIPQRREKMDEKEKDDRLAALNEACRHRLASESADDIVTNAQKYFEFLQGDKSE